MDNEITSLVNMAENEDKSQNRIDDNGNINLAKLSDNERNKYLKIASSLSENDINSVANYGNELQTTMTKYSNDFLTAVRSQQCGEMGELVNSLLKELDYIDVDELKEPNKLVKFIGRIPLIGKLVNNVNGILTKYDNIATNVDTIAKKIGVTRLSSLRDNNTLNIMFENNLAYGKQLNELIIAGKLKLDEVSSKIENMKNNPNDYESYQIQDMEEFYHNLERRLSDMLILRHVIKQSLPQIRTVQYNNIAIAEKAQSMITTTIPIWRNQLSIAVALNNQKDNIKAQHKISETTNLLLKKNAELLRLNSIDAAKENEKSVVDVETLRETTKNLIDTIKEVKKIHEEASSNRKSVENEIFNIEKELENSLILPSNSMSRAY